MNVNELADLIEFDAPIVGINKEAADMLRQLQAECDRLYRIIELNGTLAEAQQEKIAELKNARDYWCLQYKDVFSKLERIANERCGGKDEDSSRHRN